MNPLSDYLGPVTPVGVLGPNQFHVTSIFRNQSAPVTVNVVPEPLTMELAMVGGGLLCAVHVRRRRLASQALPRPGLTIESMSACDEMWTGSEQVTLSG